MNGENSWCCGNSAEVYGRRDGRKNVAALIIQRKKLFCFDQFVLGVVWKESYIRWWNEDFFVSYLSVKRKLSELVVPFWVYVGQTDSAFLGIIFSPSLQDHLGNVFANRGTSLCDLMQLLLLSRLFCSPMFNAAL